MSKSYGLKGIEENTPDMYDTFNVLNESQIDFGRAVHNNIDRELRKINRLRSWSSFCLGASTGILITYLILKLL